MTKPLCKSLRLPYIAVGRVPHNTDQMDSDEKLSLSPHHTLTSQAFLYPIYMKPRSQKRLLCYSWYTVFARSDSAATILLNMLKTEAAIQERLLYKSGDHWKWWLMILRT